MTQAYDLNTKRKQVRYLIETVPGLLDQPVFALLLFWKVFDGCVIDKPTFDSIMTKGTPPDSLTRLVRFALADIEHDRLSAIEQGENARESDRHLLSHHGETDPPPESGRIDGNSG